jgi:hypothetical protein
MTKADSRLMRPIVKSFRLSAAHLQLITEECNRRRISFSDFARLSLIGNLSRDTKRSAIAQWGKTDP